jgi:hypothetical protein
MKGTDATLLSDFNAKIAAIRSIIGANAGSGKEQPFRAMELALSTPLISGGNNGFLRPGSRLAVVFLSDEDDCSETGTNNADDNYKCHNDGRVDANADGITQSTEPPDGVDYKFTKIDTIDHYESFLRGPIAGEPRDVVLAAIAGVDSVTRSPTCGFDAMQQNRWCCGSALLSSSLTCPASAPTCASRQVSNGGLSGDAYCCGDAASPYCTSTCKTAYDKADRFEVLLSRFAPTKRLVASVCDADYSNTLSQIAGLITSNSVPLQGEPADWRLLNVGLRLPDGSRLPCSLALDGTPEAQTADAVYTPGSGGKPPAVTFPDSGSCYLDRGYSVGVEIDVICAG